MNLSIVDLLRSKGAIEHSHRREVDADHEIALFIAEFGDLPEPYLVFLRSYPQGVWFRDEVTFVAGDETWEIENLYGPCPLRPDGAVLRERMPMPEDTGLQPDSLLIGGASGATQLLLNLAANEVVFWRHDPLIWKRGSYAKEPYNPMGCGFYEFIESLRYEGET